MQVRTVRIAELASDPILREQVERLSVGFTECFGTVPDTDNLDLNIDRSEQVSLYLQSPAIDHP